MTAHSRHGSHIVYDGDALTEHSSVDAGIGHAIENNLNHAHDMASQQRMQWVAAGAQDGVSRSCPSSDRWYFIWRWTFPWSFAIDGWLRQPVIWMQGYGEGTALNFRAKVSPYFEARTQDERGTSIFGADADTFLSLDRSTTASTPQNIFLYPEIDTGIWQASKADMRERISQRGLRSFAADAETASGTHKVTVHVPTLALEVYARYDADAEVQSAYVTRASVREFIG